MSFLADVRLQLTRLEKVTDLLADRLLLRDVGRGKAGHVSFASPRSSSTLPQGAPLGWDPLKAQAAAGQEQMVSAQAAVGAAIALAMVLAGGGQGGGAAGAGAAAGGKQQQPQPQSALSGGGTGRR